MASTSTAASEQGLVQNAQAAYVALKAQWETYSYSYWQLGHSFDTIIDYFTFVDPSDAANFSQIAQQAHTSSLGSACWYDDFGWWGIATLKAAQHRGLFGDVGPFVKIYQGCWTTMQRGTQVWANNKNNPSLAPLQPRFDGGVWNCDWSGQNACNEQNSPAPIPPSQCGSGGQGDPVNLRGIQNTVTNGLYLVLALRLYEATGDPQYLSAAKREYGFLNDWINVPDTDNALLWYPGGGHPGALARERMATYASKTPVCGYDRYLGWSGDQGIIVGGMVDWMIAVSADNNPNSAAWQNAVAILSLVADFSNDGVVKPWISGNGGDVGDYSTGIGVFMRYLLYADQKNLQSMRKITRGSNYQSLLNANVQAVLNNSTPDQGANQLTHLTNCLAILVAAIQMSKN